jgi:hypothetical protein
LPGSNYVWLVAAAGWGIAPEEVEGRPGGPAEPAQNLGKLNNGNGLRVYRANKKYRNGRPLWQKIYPEKIC